MQLLLKTLDQLQPLKLVVDLPSSETGWNGGKLGSMGRKAVPYFILVEASRQLRIRNPNITPSICLSPFSSPSRKHAGIKASHQFKDMPILPVQLYWLLVLTYLIIVPKHFHSGHVILIIEI